MTHALLFTQNADSMAIAKKFYGTTIIRQRRLDISESGPTIVACVALDDRFGGRFPSLRDFEIFGDRMAHILRRMEDWKPHTFRELFVNGYKGRFEWWVAMFGVFVGVISILVLGMGIWAAVVAQKQYNLALKLAALQSS
jgi:hypothetical protein